MPPELIVIVGMLLRTLPWFIFGAAGLFLFSRSALGKSLIRRLQESAEESHTVAQLQADVAELQHELEDVQERLDFAERRLLLQPPSSPPPESGTPSPPEPLPAAGR